MKKSIVASLVILGIISLFFIFIPNVHSLPENVEVTNYSWYVSEGGYLVVVGEVQNLSPNIVDYVYLEGGFYTQDDVMQAISSTLVYSDHIHPQQKAPFHMYFPPESSATGDYSWTSIGLDRVEFLTTYANQTDYYQYPDLEIIGDTAQISGGLYTVTGSVRNTGNEETGRLWIIGTFYNASGHVIAAGYSIYLTPNRLLPDQTTLFTVAPVDSTSEISNQIRSYSLLVQTEAPIIPELPSWMILPLFMVITLLAVIVYRKRLKMANKQ